MIDLTDKIVFVYPYEQQPSANKASQLRPYMMEQAFKEALGENLLVSNGKKRFKNISNKENIQGLYLESINRPFFIQRIIEKDWRIFSDYWNIWKLKRKGIKLSVFYRDCFWAGKFLFEHYPLLVAVILKWSYQLEWLFFKKLFDIIYLPSFELAEFMGEKDLNRYKVLLPGCNPVKLIEATYSCSQKLVQSELTLLYSGGITPPLNDITLMLELLGGRTHIHLTVIVRKEEWDKYHSYYNCSYQNVDIVLDKQADQLHEYYACSDASLMLYPSHPYRYVAMPYKAFEAMSHGVPLISFADCIMGDFIKQNKLGFALTYDELMQSFNKASELSDKLQEYRDNVMNYTNTNTWIHRVEQIVHDFNHKIE